MVVENNIGRRQFDLPSFERKKGFSEDYLDC